MTRPLEQPAGPGASLGALLPLVRREPALAEVSGRSNATLAVAAPGRAAVLAALADGGSRRPVVVATPTASEATRLAHDLRSFLGSAEVALFPAWETLPFERVSPSVETMGARLSVLWWLGASDRSAGGRSAGGGWAGRGAAGTGGPKVIVAPVKALLQRLAPGEPERVLVRKGDELDPAGLVERLVGLGYRREYQVEHRGEVAARGGIVDVYPSTSEMPVRVDLWGDEVDRLSSFDPGTQRSIEALDAVELFGCRELKATPEVASRAKELLESAPWGRAHWERLAEGLSFDGMESWLPWVAGEDELLTDSLGSQALVVLAAPRQMRDRAVELVDEEAGLASVLAQTWSAEGELPRLHLGFERLLARSGAAVLSVTDVAESPSVPAVQVRALDVARHDVARLASDLASMSRQGSSVVVSGDTEQSTSRMARSLVAEGLEVATGQEAAGSLGRPGIRAVVAPLSRGFVLPASGLAVLAEPDVTGRRAVHRPARPRSAAPQGFFDDLQPGQFVVHRHHGVGRYAGMQRRAIGGGSDAAAGGGERDYLVIEYKGDDKLYVPSDQIDSLTPYAGGETPSLHRLGGSDFERAKAKVRSAVAEIADELVELYRRRLAVKGHAYPPDTPWQREMEELFAFTETPDQAKAIDEVKADMERESPMDRLVVGDVGFGKTEIAIRAAFKAVQDGKQAAVLVPTTLLAHQHFQTFSDRFAGYPVRVEVLSRFLTPAQAKVVTDGIADGSVDVVIGTHRLLSGDVRFRGLGLLVVDEEQRFGVTHKEAVKALTAKVDVVTLAATPIPRTLEMGLTGIRDLTVLNTPPAERQPILTYVGEYDEQAVSEAVRRELLREGQVFFVHNRIADIDQAAERLRKLVPEARVVVAHGQMDEGSLEKVVYDFWEGSYDVLVCTTIIESGIDMPTVNTLVVDRADALGLGQLHQLRGRVGRAGMRAYAYLFFPPDKALSEEAYERLRTIGENTELGSGFKIAMRDLEIRGAGNLLGADQSGHIAAVGYDLYVRLVSEAVAAARGEEMAEPVEVKLELPVNAHLPSAYVSREDLRLEAYRRLAAVTTEAEVADIAEEWADRFGPPPPPAEQLLAIAALRAECVRAGVSEVTVTTRRLGATAQVHARLAPVRLAASRAIRLKRMWPKALYKEDLGQLVVPLESASDAASALVELLRELVPAG
ncbi:MAG: transcription-repair coupling factor [Acidimicrobiales bacterium]